MTLEQQKKTFIDYLYAKVMSQDWHAVSDAANDLREIEVRLKYGLRAQVKDEALPVKEDKDIPPQAIPPVDLEIPHRLNEVRSVLKMSDEELIDKLFPEPQEVVNAEQVTA